MLLKPGEYYCPIGSSEDKKIFHEQLLRHGILTSCKNCEHSVEVLVQPANIPVAPFKALKCEQFNCIPPADVLVVGCGVGWEMQIPF